MRVDFSIFLPDREVKRIDLVLSTIFKEHSRSSLQKVIERWLVQVNGKVLDRQCKVRCKDLVSIEFVPEKSTIEAEDLPIDIIYENEYFAIINKDPFMNVHPVSGEHGRTGTLVNALLHHLGNLSVIGWVERPGLVHRLDKDTSWLLIIAKNDRTLRALQKKMFDRKVKKRYLAFVRGEIREEDGFIESYIGRDPNDRKKMTTKKPVVPRLAQTKFRTIECTGWNSLLLVELLTWRTHQIRVHVADIGYPIIGDTTYGNQKTNREFQEKTWLKRQWLHAYHLEFELFWTCYSFKAPLKQDLQDSIENAVLERNGIVNEAEISTWTYREDSV